MTPVFYTFRRCPYAMRARLALVASNSTVALREVVLRDKPAAFLEASPSATVPCLVTQDGTIDESLDIMVWALKRNDPEGWLALPCAGWDWISQCDGHFKQALDRTKYATRYPDGDPVGARNSACAFLSDLEEQLDEYLFGVPTIADFAILPFVRQFAAIDEAWFDAQDFPKLQRWLRRFLDSEAFAKIMPKYYKWHADDPIVTFPPASRGKMLAR